MKNPFEWFHSLYYGERLSLQDFDTKNPASLDALLKQIFMTGHKAGKYRMKNSLPAFNAAYYVAACLFNSEAVDETNFDDDIDTKIREIWLEDYKRYHKEENVRCPYRELVLIKWMVYAILTLQESKSNEMILFLDDFRSELRAANEPDEDLLHSEEYERYAFLFDLPGIIEKWPYRYHTDLRPRPLSPQYFSGDLWVKVVRHYSLNDYKCQLRLYQTKEEQLAFLKWSKEESLRPQPYDFPEDCLF